MPQPLTRRTFGKVSSVAALGLLHPGSFVLGDDAASSKTNEKLNLAIIGSGGRGRANLGGVSGENIVALCDVNRAAIDPLRSRFPDAKTTSDWRELVDDSKIDGFVISTADHHHALAALAAMRAGKHVYCEKPLAHTVREARAMREEYVKHRGTIATQMGTQIHAGDNFRRSVELIRSGAIGPVREAHVWCSRSISPVKVDRLPEQPVPEGFDWDVWLGPAAARPYNTGYWKGGNLNWNRRWEFGNGVLGDMGSHLIDLAFWALALRTPLTIEARGPQPDPIACPPWQEVVWEHGPRSGGDVLDVPTKVIWYHGPEGMRLRSERLQPQLGTDTDLSRWGIGVAFVGDDGILVSDYGRRVLSPSAEFTDFTPPEASIPASLGHHAEWIAACKGGPESLCNFDYSGALIEHNLLGNVAFRAGKKLKWDAENFRIPNVPDAEQYLSKGYRKGWEPVALTEVAMTS